MEISVATMPIWYVALEASNYPKDAFPNGIPVYYHFVLSKRKKRIKAIFNYD